MRKLTSILLLLLVVTALSTQAKAFEDRLSLVRIYAEDTSELLPLLYMGMDIIGGEPGQYVDALVKSDELKLLIGMGYQMEVLEEEVRGQKDKGYQDYHTYWETCQELLQTESDHPDIAKLYYLGMGWDGHFICAMKISDNVDTEESEREIFSHGCTHSREPMSVEIVLRQIQELTNGYASDPDCTHIVDNLEIWFIPMLNPDGHVYDGYAQYGTKKLWRKNFRDNNDSGYFEPSIDGVDLNRNYTFMWGYDDYGSSPYMGDDTYRGPWAGSEPETQMVMNLHKVHDYIIGLSYHAALPAILHPYGWNQTDPPPEDLAIYEEIADQINDGIESVLGFRYPVGRGDEFLWYWTNGDYADFGLGEYGTYSFTIEATDYYEQGFYPDDSDIPIETEAQWEGFKNTCIWLIDEYEPSDILITGFTAQPKMNQVNLSWWAETTQDEHILGFNLYRKVGAHSMETPLNYTQKTEEFIKINHALITGQNPYSFTDSGLTPMTHYTYMLETVIEEGTPPAPSTTSTSTLSPSTFAIASVYPLPADDSATVEFILDQPSEVQLALYDISGRLTCIVFADYLDAGEHRRVMETAGLSSGVYILELRSMDRTCTRAVVVAH